MYVKQIDEIKVTGIRIRTSNSKEVNTDTCQIPSLWESFHTVLVPHLGEDSNIYGVYCNYESNVDGHFDVVAGSDKFVGDLERDTVIIQSGKYLVFEGKGDLPQVVTDVWSKIWSYFSSDEANFTRVYTCDFELYKSSNEIEIYIAIK